MKPLLVIVAVLVAAAPARAGTTLVLPDGTTPQPEQTWVDNAKVPTPNVTVTLNREACPAISAEVRYDLCAYAATRTIWIAPSRLTKHDLFHELFHIYRPLMPAWQRAWLWDWDEETLAEAYGLCARRLKIRHEIWKGYGYIATPRLHERVCALLRQP